MKRLVLALVLALVLVGSASAEPLATYQHTFEFSGSGSGGILDPSTYSYYLSSEEVPGPSTVSGGAYDLSTAGGSFSGSGVYISGSLDSSYTSDNPYSVDVPDGESYYNVEFQVAGIGNFADFVSVVVSYAKALSSANPDIPVILSIQTTPNVQYLHADVFIYPIPNNPGFTVTMVSEVHEPWFDLFGMRGLSASFTPSNPDEDYYILFAGADSWVGQNPEKWIWSRVHGSTNKYKIIFSGNEYIWFVKYNDEIQQFSFNYTGDEGVVPPVIVPDPEPEPPVTPPIIDTPGDVDPNYPSMPDLESPDLSLDFTSGFEEYENMPIYQNVRKMIDGFISSISPNIETTQFYQVLQQVIAYLELVMEQLKQKYAVPIYNILASVSSFVPPICWLAVNIAVIFGMFRFVVHIVTGPISSAIRERF